MLSQAHASLNRIQRIHIANPNQLGSKAQLMMVYVCNTRYLGSCLLAGYYLVIQLVLDTSRTVVCTPCGSDIQQHKSNKYYTKISEERRNQLNVLINKNNNIGTGRKSSEGKNQISSSSIRFMNSRGLTFNKLHE